MAGKSKHSTTKSSGSTNVTHITAKDTRTKKKETSEVADEPSTTKRAAASTTRTNPLIAIGRYFAGAWEELKQVRWPTRRATWSMTAAMLLFTGFFVAVILLLDALFKYLFELMLG